MNNHGFHNESTPDDLSAVESSLSRLGEHERASAPAGFEARIQAATGHMLSADDAPVVIARIGHRMSFVAKLRIAASVAIVGGLAALYLSNSPTNVLSSTAARSLEEDMNYVLDLKSSDESMSAMSEKIDILFMDATSLGDSLKSDPSTSLLDGAS